MSDWLTKRTLDKRWVRVLSSIEGIHGDRRVRFKQHVKGLSLWIIMSFETYKLFWNPWRKLFHERFGYENYQQLNIFMITIPILFNPRFPLSLPISLALSPSLLLSISLFHYLSIPRFCSSYPPPPPVFCLVVYHHVFECIRQTNTTRRGY